MIRLIFHTIAFLHFFVSLWYDQMYVDIPSLIKPEKRILFFKGRLIYLTLWNMVLQTVFFSICVLNDLIGSNEIQKKLPIIRKIKDTIFTSLAFPLSMFVGLTFWALYGIDRELVFPRSLDPYFPVWLNHVMHTNIMIFILIEMFTSFRVYPTQKKGLSVLIGFMLAYLVWMHVVYYKTDIWVYPVMAVLNTPLRICFFLVLLGLSVALYKLGDFVNQKIWKKQIRDVQGGKVKGK